MGKALIAVCLAVVFATPAFSEMKNMPKERKCSEPMESCSLYTIDGHGEGMGGVMGTCLEYSDKMGFTDDQVSKFKHIHREMQKKMIKIDAEVEIAQIEMKEIMEVKDFDLDKAVAQVKKIADLKTAQHSEMLKSMKEERSILTDDQFIKMQKMMRMEMAGAKPHKKMKMRK